MSKNLYKDYYEAMTAPDSDEWALGCDTAEKTLVNEGVTLVMAAGFLESLRPQPKQDKGPIAKFVQAVEDAEQHRKGYEEGLRDGMKKHYKPSEVCYGAKGDPDPAGVWKPSGEQMDALLWCAAHLGGADHRVLAELYEHLKKLM